MIKCSIAAIVRITLKRSTPRAILPLRRMPDWLRPLIGWLMPRIGPRGVEFARARVEMKAMETIVHLRRSLPKRMRHMVPSHVWTIAAPYGLKPAPDEIRRESQTPDSPQNNRADN